MKEYLISTKADTLADLREIVKHSYIEELSIVYAEDFFGNPAGVIAAIKEQFTGETIVVRSSSKSEDNLETSNAGHFESVLGVDASKDAAITEAIETVYRSYVEGDFTEEAKQQLIEANEEVLIQRQTDHVRISGVVFTRDIIYNRPYYMVTYDDNGSTDSVTSGVRGKTKWIAKNASREFLEYEFVDLLTAVKEIERIYEYVSALDIEFAILEDGTVVIFQVRPLAAALKIIAPMTDREFKDTKALAKCKYLDTFHILSDMAFWNPAEIIGSNPRPLDYSLYRELITAHIWSAGLQPLGYQPVRGELMQKVGNKPYISVNYTFDGLVYAVYVSLGFALAENLLYVFSYGISVALPRALLTIPAHMSFGVYMGAFYGLAKVYDAMGDSDASKRYARIGLIVAMVLHGVYDALAMLSHLSFFYIAFYVFVVVLDILV